LIQELQAHDLLVTQSFNLKIEGEIQTILKDYKIVDRDRLMSLDDEILAQWAKRGWIGIIDAHIYSLSNFEKLVQRIK
jgi:predicted DNA-binding transcriptional regulator